MAGEKKQFLERWFSREVSGKQGPAIAGEQKEEFVTEIRPRLRRHSPLKQVMHISFTVLIIVLIVAIFASALLYVFQVRSVGATKETLEKPTLATDANIETQHIAYILNELGAYKIHPSFFGGKDPLILVWITNTGQKFRATLVSEKLDVAQGDADEYDIIVALDEKTFREVYAADDPLALAKDKVERKRISIDKGAKDLQMLLRGYAAFKETIFPPETALFFFTSAQLKAIYVVVVILLLLFTVWYFRHV